MIGKRKGFSLIEVLIGLVILAIGLLAVAGLQVTSIRGNYSSNNVTQATYIAQSRLEFLKTLDFTSDRLKQGDYDPDPFTGKVTVSGIDFNLRYRVDKDFDPVIKLILTRITYTVSWTDGVAHGISFSTIRSQ
jgi:type IV pilus assembly protein PilV